MPRISPISAIWMISGAAVTEEGHGDARHREEVGHHSHVGKHLEGEERGDAHHDQAPNLSRAWRASQYPRIISRANTARIRQAPMRPNSSHTMAKIKSFWASGR